MYVNEWCHFLDDSNNASFPLSLGIIGHMIAGSKVSICLDLDPAGGLSSHSMGSTVCYLSKHKPENFPLLFYDSKQMFKLYY